MKVRPIDGKLLKDAIQCWIDTQSEFVDVETCETVLKVIDLLPTITQPKIVFCQDCEYHLDNGDHYCTAWKRPCPDDSEFFCKYGRGKDGSTTD